MRHNVRSDALFLKLSWSSSRRVFGFAFCACRAREHVRLAPGGDSRDLFDEPLMAAVASIERGVEMAEGRCRAGRCCLALCCAV